MSDRNFCGVAKLYDESIYIDTDTGEGLDLALKKIDPLLCKMAGGTYIDNYSFDDIKQLLATIAIEGIRSYDPGKDVKLSTFLHVHLRNKLISKLRSENKMSNDAFVFNDNSSDDQVKKVRGAVRFSQISEGMSSSSDEGGPADFESNISESSGLYFSAMSSIDRLEFVNALERLSSNLDPKTSKILELICLKDYSIKDAAKTVGLSGWAASMRLKKLSKNKIARDMLLNRSKNAK